MSEDSQRQQLAMVIAGVVVIGGGFWWWTQTLDETPDTPERVQANSETLEEPPKPNASGKPNVLIVLWDTVRADRLTVYDDSRPTTPWLAEWAEDAVVFEQAISPAMWTVPSHASLFTGLPQTTHGAGLDHLWLDNHHVTLAEWLSQQGYDSFAFSANPNLSPRRLNLLQGFDRIEASFGPRWRKKANQLARNKLIERDASTEISPAWTGAKPAETPQFAFNAGPLTQKSFTAWLDKRPDQSKPWVAYLSYMEAHKPRIPSMESRKKVANADRIELGLVTDLSFDQQLGYSYGQRGYTEAELDAIMAVYDATLVDLDNTTRALFAQLEAQGQLDNTIVVFTSDHGEMLGEHQLFGHRNGLYNALVRVPLIISFPKELEGRRVAQAVSNLDVFDTVLALADLPAPDGVRSGGNLVGEQLGRWGVFTEATDHDIPGFRRVSKIFPGAKDLWDRTFAAVIEGNHKLITDSLGAHELYHLGHDPNEEQNLAEREADQLATLVARLKEIRDAIPAYDPSKRGKGDEVAEDSDEAKEMLEILGYIEEDEEDSDDEATEEAPEKTKSKSGKKRRKAKAPAEE